MASKINADEFVDREGEGKPTLPKGVVLSGVTTITTAVVAENEVANSTGINAGIITSTHFKGNLTGDVNAGIVTVTSQTVVGSAVTISASGIDIGAGVITATSYAGSGANLTGIGATIMTWEYNPDPGDMAVPFATGIGITFNQKIKAGSGNITLREDSSSGTVVENFGIGSSGTIAGNSLSMTPTSDLSENKIYHLSYPSGVITNMAGDSYVGTAYTFKALGFSRQVWMWGYGSEGALGQNSQASYSSPIQVPGTTWSNICRRSPKRSYHSLATKTDGTLWIWGWNERGTLGQNGSTSDRRSSPVQIPGTWGKDADLLAGNQWTAAIKTDGTLWMWGQNQMGELGQNDVAHRSSPVQVPGTTWSKIDGAEEFGYNLALKTDGTLWSWGYSRTTRGLLGLGDTNRRSSPTQIPGTTWSDIGAGIYSAGAVRTDGTLWVWGHNWAGCLGLNQAHDNTKYSSPKQIPGTNWSKIRSGFYNMAAIKTDGTLWTWGSNSDGRDGTNSGQNTDRSSPVQVPGTTWSDVWCGGNGSGAIKTDGTIWSWGYNAYGMLGLNQAQPVKVSSPIQIGTDTDWTKYHGGWQAMALKVT